MARVDESLAQDVFPTERPPPQDPEVQPWRFPKRTRAQAPVAFDAETDPIFRALRARERQLLAQRDRSAQTTDDLVSWLKTGQEPPGFAERQREDLAGGGPIGTGAPGSLAGYVKIIKHPRTGLPERVLAGGGPPQRALPPGQVEKPPSLDVDVSGKPGGPLHVDYFKGTQESPHAARRTAVGTERGPGMAEGKEIMDELVHHLDEGGYTGVDFWAIGSDATPAERAAARREGSSHLPSIRNEGRLRVNEAYIGSKAVPRGGGHEIPLPRVLPPKPDWFQSEPQPTAAQRQHWSPVRTPEQAARHRESRLDESDFLAQEMRRLRREGLDPIDARRQAEALLEERRAGTPAPGYTSTGQARPPGPSRQESIERLHQAILQQHPEATISRGTLTSLVDDYRETVGVSPTDVNDLRDYALRAGHIDQAAMDRLLGPAATTPMNAAARSAGLTPPTGPGANATDAANLLESYRAQFQAQQGRHVATFGELRAFATEQGYVSPHAFDDTWEMAYGAGSLPRRTTTTEEFLRQGTTPSTPAPPSEARRAAGREANLARREAEQAAVHRAGRRGATVSNQEALLRRVQERQGASMARETEQETRRALRAGGQTEMFRGTEPTRAARAEPRPRAPRGFQADPEETARQGYPVEPGGAQDLATERGAMLNRAETHNRVAQNLYATDDRAHFDRALLVAQQETTRLGRSLRDEEVQSILRNTRQGEGTRQTPRTPEDFGAQDAALDIGPPDLTTEAGRHSAREEYLAGQWNPSTEEFNDLFHTEAMRLAALRARARRMDRQQTFVPRRGQVQPPE